MLELIIACSAGFCLGVLLMCLLQINRVPGPQQEPPDVVEPPATVAKKEPTYRYNPHTRKPERLP